MTTMCLLKARGFCRRAWSGVRTRKHSILVMTQINLPAEKSIAVKTWYYADLFGIRWDCFRQVCVFLLSFFAWSRIAALIVFGYMLLFSTYKDSLRKDQSVRNVFVGNYVGRRKIIPTIHFGNIWFYACKELLKISDAALLLWDRFRSEWNEWRNVTISSVIVDRIYIVFVLTSVLVNLHNLHITMIS